MRRPDDDRRSAAGPGGAAGRTENLQAAFAAAQAGADRTCQSSKAGAGRASYLNSDSLLGNMDPGAHAVAMVFKALAER